MNIEDKKKLEETLKTAGYVNASVNVRTKEINGKTYGVDLLQGLVFRLEDMERIEDPEDSVIQSIQKMITGDEEPTPAKKNDTKEPTKTHIKEPETEITTTDETVYIPEIVSEIPVRTAEVRISNRIKGINPQLCECGKIKIGKKGKMVESKRGNNFRPPEKLDHFVVVTTTKDQNEDFVLDRAIMEQIGETCIELPIRLLYDDPALNFPTSYACYDSAACQCRGDGEHAQKADGTIIACDTDSCPLFQQKKCKGNGVLSVLLDDAPRVGGVYKFRTTSWNSIRNIMSSLEFIRGITAGYLAGLPLVMTLQPKTTLIPGTKTTTTIYMVNVEYRGSMAQLLDTVRETVQNRSNALGAIGELEKLAHEQLLLPESSEECKDVQEEFYPETCADEEIGQEVA